MPDVESVKPVARPQFRIRTLLTLVAFAAIALGWWADHQRAAAKLRRAEQQLEIHNKQLELAQRFLREAQSSVAVLDAPEWQLVESGEAVVNAVANIDPTIKDTTDRFYHRLPKLAKVDEAIITAAMPGLLAQLQDEKDEVRGRAIAVLRSLQRDAPQKMKPHAEDVVAGLIPRVDDTSSMNEGEAIGALAAFGSDARPAVEKLRAKMMDDKAWYAPLAATTVHSIDPTIDIGPRLVELIRIKHPQWYSAACTLPAHVPPDRARKILTEFYDTLTAESDRNALVQALSRIPAEAPAP